MKGFRPHPAYADKPPGRRCWAQFSLRGLDERIDWVAIRGPRAQIERMIEKGRLRHEATIHWDRRADRWRLIVPFTVEAEDASAAAAYAPRVVALDPGVKHFQTFYAGDGTHGRLAVNLRTRDDDAEAQQTRTHALADATAALDRARANLLPADHARWQRLRGLLERQRAAEQTGTHHEWRAARAAVRDARRQPARTDSARRRENAVRRARRRVQVATLDLACEGRLAASLERSRRLAAARERLTQRRHAHGDFELHHARDVHRDGRWRRRAHREHLRRAGFVANAHYSAIGFLLDRYDAVPGGHGDADVRDPRRRSVPAGPRAAVPPARARRRSPSR